MWLFANAGDARLGRANNRKLYSKMVPASA
jgi:hypothetical protein